MRTSLFVAAMIAAIACTGIACGNSSGSGGWTGTWSCSFVLNDTFGGNSWMGLIDITDGSNGSIEITPITDSGTPCSLSATTSGSTGTFATSQPCSVPDGTFGGTLKLSGGSLTISESWTDPVAVGTEQATCVRP